MSTLLAAAAAAALCHLDHVGASAAPDPLGRGAWLADPTQDQVLLATPRAGVERFTGCTWPSQLVVDSLGAAYVSCRGSGEVQKLTSHEEPVTWAAGPEPTALALDEDARRLYVGLATSNAVVMLDARSGRELKRLDVGVEPTALGLLGDTVVVASRKSDRLQLFARDLEGAPRIVTVDVEPPAEDFEVSVGVDRLVPTGDGLMLVAPLAQLGSLTQPTYYGADTGSPVEQALFVLEDRPEPQLKFVRTLSLPEISGAFYDPRTHLMSFTSRGVGGLVTLDVRDGSLNQTWVLPSGVVALADDGHYTFVLDDADREVRVKSSSFAARWVWPRGALTMVWERKKLQSTPAEVMALGQSEDAELARGRALFHRADDTRIASSALSCATCHRDGRDDGRTWLGQGGMRQTPMLAGRDIAHTAPYGWNGGYAKLEGYIAFTIRERMQGYGLSPADLKALARYVREGLRPVARPAVADTSAVKRGRIVFHASGVGCSGCHGAAESFTDGERHDVGSLGVRERLAWKSLNGDESVQTPDDAALLALSVAGAQAQTSVLRSLGTSPLSRLAPPRLAVPASARRFDTPSLEQVALTAPYLHDGSATTLEQVFARLGDHMGTVSSLTSRERGDLVAYLKTL
jgi:cytochrome c peroxidase